MVDPTTAETSTYVHRAAIVLLAASLNGLTGTQVTPTVRVQVAISISALTTVGQEARGQVIQVMQVIHARKSYVEN